MTKTFIPVKPYFIRALYEWCTDNGFTPHIAVAVDEMTRVPREFVRRDGQTVFNISMDATGSLALGNEYIEFMARFGGVAHSVSIPVARVAAIYARENDVGMGFEVEETSFATALSPDEQRDPVKASLNLATENDVSSDSGDEPPKPPRARPRLQRVK